MGETTGISWTTATFNPFIGCSRVSPGCIHCYAEAQAKRYGWDVWGAQSPRRVTSDQYWKQPLRWNREAQAEGKRKLVFCGSMCDWAEDRADLIEPRKRLFDLIAKTPNLTWQLLTKRPENIRQFLPEDWGCGWPNVWIGTTAENQEWADRRVPILLEVPAVVRFLSVEPMIGPVDLTEIRHPVEPVRQGMWIKKAEVIDALTGEVADVLEGHGTFWSRACNQIDWVIVGGESGPNCRPMQIEWARDLLRQCRETGVPCFVKQLGGHPNKRHLLSDFPEDLRVQEFPG